LFKFKFRVGYTDTRTFRTFATTANWADIRCYTLFIDTCLKKLTIVIDETIDTAQFGRTFWATFTTTFKTRLTGTRLWFFSTTDERGRVRFFAAGIETLTTFVSFNVT